MTVGRTWGVVLTGLHGDLVEVEADLSNQTPAFGSLPGSEGGDFVFELPGETEFLSPNTTQLSTEAIAMNSKLDAKPAAASVTVKDLQGGEQKIVTPGAVPSTTRQMAQRANDRG